MYVPCRSIGLDTQTVLPCLTRSADAQLTLYMYNLHGNIMISRFSKISRLAVEMWNFLLPFHTDNSTVRFDHMIPLSCWFRGWELLDAGDVEPPDP